MSDLLDQSALTDLAERLVEAARRAGADTSDAAAVRSVSLGIEVREGAVEESDRAEGDDVGLRVFVGRRQAVISTNGIGANVNELAERAVAMAKVAPEDAYAGLADPDQLARDIPQLDLLDPDLPSVAVLEQRAKGAEAAGLAITGVSKSGGASASAGIGGMVLVTSHGFRGAYLNSRQSLSMTAIAGERAVARLNPRKVSTAKVPVVFDRRVAGSLVSHLASAANGSAVARKTSFLREKLGERLFKPGIRIVDDPLRERGLRSRPFDGEGVAAKPLAVIDDGVLTSWFLDSATARELNLPTTGHAHRGVSSAPSPGPTNLHLEPGQQSPEELMADITEGFYVTDLIGMGVNGVTGDYSRGASGFWIENGRPSYPVSEVTIAGNLIAMFAALRPANDLEFRFGTNAPTVRVEGLTIGGR